MIGADRHYSTTIQDAIESISGSVGARDVKATIRYCYSDVGFEIRIADPEKPGRELVAVLKARELEWMNAWLRIEATK